MRQYPELRNAVVNVSTTYFGADADLIQGFITTPLEREIASAEGIDSLVQFRRRERDPGFTSASTRIPMKLRPRSRPR